MIEALIFEHHGALRHRELLKRRSACRCIHAAPIHGAEVKRPAAFGEASDPGCSQVRIGLEEMQAVITLITQRVGNHVFLRLIQAGKWRVDGGGTGCTPIHVGVGVVGHHTLFEVADQLLARSGVVIEELRRSRRSR